MGRAVCWLASINQERDKIAKEPKDTKNQRLLEKMMSSKLLFQETTWWRCSLRSGRRSRSRARSPILCPLLLKRLFLRPCLRFYPRLFLSSYCIVPIGKSKAPPMALPKALPKFLGFLLFKTQTSPPSQKCSSQGQTMGLKSLVVIIIITDVQLLFMIGFVSMIIIALNNNLNRVLIPPLSLASRKLLTKLSVLLCLLCIGLRVQMLLEILEESDQAVLSAWQEVSDHLLEH